MKKYLSSLFKENRNGILFIWSLDLINIISQMFLPLLIGKTIDDLLGGGYNWLCIFIAIEVLLLIINSANRYYDNRVYTKVVYKAASKYIEKANKDNTDLSVISARVGYIDSFIDVFNSQVPSIVSTVIGIGFVIFYLLVNGYTIIFSITLTVAIICFFIQKSVRKKILSAQIKLNDETERQVSCLETKKQYTIGRHFLKLFSFQIKLSDIDTKTYFWISLLQISLLGASLIVLIETSVGITAGAIFAVMTYIGEFNGYATSIPEYYQHYLWLKDASRRLDKNN